MTTPRDVLAAAHASWNAGDLDGYLTMYDDRIQLHGYTPDMLGLLLQLGAVPPRRR